MEHSFFLQDLDEPTLERSPSDGTRDTGRKDRCAEKLRSKREIRTQIDTDHKRMLAAADDRWTYCIHRPVNERGHDARAIEDVSETVAPGRGVLGAFACSNSGSSNKENGRSCLRSEQALRHFFS